MTVCIGGDSPCGKQSVMILRIAEMKLKQRFYIGCALYPDSPFPDLSESGQQQ